MSVVDRGKLIPAIDSPLKFFTLTLLIGEALAGIASGTTAATVEGDRWLIPATGGVVLAVLAVLIVGLAVFLKAAELMGLTKPFARAIGIDIYRAVEPYLRNEKDPKTRREACLTVIEMVRSQNTDFTESIAKTITSEAERRGGPLSEGALEETQEGPLLHP